MTGIDIIKGKISLSAVAMATVLKRHGDYDYRVRRHDNDGCEIEFFYDGDSLGISSFTIEDATQAGIFKINPNYKKYPRNMLFARAMSNGIRWYCPEVLGGPTYTPGELEQETEIAADDGEVMEGEIVGKQIDDFATSLKNWDAAKALVNKEINDMYENGNRPPSLMLAGEILPIIQKEYPDSKYDNVKIQQMIKEIGA